MVDYALAYTVQFDASHQLPDVPKCAALHGHTYTVTATVVGNLEPDENDIPRVQYAETLDDLMRIAVELDDRHLNDMIPGSITVQEVLAAWFLERLSDADYVEVVQGWRKVTGRATRNKRR